MIRYRLFLRLLWIACQLKRNNSMNFKLKYNMNIVYHVLADHGIQ